MFTRGYVQRVEHRAAHPLEVVIGSYALTSGRLDRLSLGSNGEHERACCGQRAFHGFVLREVEAVTDDDCNHAACDRGGETHRLGREIKL